MSMTGLSMSGYRKMLDLAVQVLHEPDANAEARTLIAAKSADILHADVSIFQATIFANSDGQPTAPESRIEGCSQEWMRRVPALPLYDRYVAIHPLADHYLRTGERIPRTVDEIADKTWRDSITFLTARDTFGITRQLAIPLSARPGVFKALAIGRSGRDFTGRDQETAREVAPLLDGLERHLAMLDQLQPMAPKSLGSREERHTTDPCQQSAKIGLTPREYTVVALLGEGLANNGIARRLAISVHTVTKHQENIYRKMGTRDRLSTVLRAQEAGILPAASNANEPSCTAETPSPRAP